MKSYTENIEKYIPGELFGDELKKFEVKLKSNKELYDEFILHTQINMALKEEDIIQLRNKLEDIYSKVIYKRERIIKLSRNIALAASVALIFTFGGIYLYKNEKLTNQQLFTAYYSPYESIENSRELSSATKSLIEQALAEYEEKDYTAAQSHFNDILKTNPDCSTALFYSSISELETGNINDAIIKLEHLLTLKDSLFNDQAEWYLGLCYLKSGNTDKAKIIFDKISGQKGYNKEKAKKLLRKLTNVK